MMAPWVGRQGRIGPLILFAYQPSREECSVHRSCPQGLYFNSRLERISTQDLHKADLPICLDLPEGIEVARAYVQKALPEYRSDFDIFFEYIELCLRPDTVLRYKLSTGALRYIVVERETKTRRVIGTGEKLESVTHSRANL